MQKGQLAELVNIVNIVIDFLTRTVEWILLLQNWVGFVIDPGNRLLENKVQLSLSARCIIWET